MVPGPVEVEVEVEEAAEVVVRGGFLVLVVGGLDVVVLGPPSALGSVVGAVVGADVTTGGFGTTGAGCGVVVRGTTRTFVFCVLSCVVVGSAGAGAGRPPPEAGSPAGRWWSAQGR